jgi:hypothetical protein
MPTSCRYLPPMRTQGENEDVPPFDETGRFLEKRENRLSLLSFSQSICTTNESAGRQLRCSTPCLILCSLPPSPPRFPVSRLSCCRSSLHACSPVCQDSAYYPSTPHFDYHPLPSPLVLHRHASQPSQDRRRQGSPPSLASPVPGLEQGKVSRRYLPSLLHLRSTPSLDHRFQQR